MTDARWGMFTFPKNALASCTVSKHAHSSTDSSCIVRTTVNTGQTHQVITALRVCILLFVCNVQEISGSETPLNTNRIKYNFVCVCSFWFVHVLKIIIYNTYPVDCANLTFDRIHATSSTVVSLLSVLECRISHGHRQRSKQHAEKTNHHHYNKKKEQGGSQTVVLMLYLVLPVLLGRNSKSPTSGNSFTWNRMEFSHIS